ncbi:unnamed protein product, partial [Closterium sp. NIES-64]
TEKIMSSSLPSILLAFTEKIMSSSLPSILLGFVYLYLLYKSWTPNTLLYMFSSKYWLPELAGITQIGNHSDVRQHAHCRLCLGFTSTHHPRLSLSPALASISPIRPGLPTPASGHHSDVRQHAHCRLRLDSTCWPLISLPPGELSGGLSGTCIWTA